MENRVVDLCLPGWTDGQAGGKSAADDYHRLCNEKMKLLIDEELFVFVQRKEAAGTNNASERQLRSDASSRKTGRTNKTPRCAKRQSIISSVLQSIGKRLKEFQLQAVIDEVRRWTVVGQSCFEAQMQKLPKSKRISCKEILKRTVSNADLPETTKPAMQSAG